MKMLKVKIEEVNKILFLALFLSTSLCWAAIGRPGVPFYRSPQSQFASGEADEYLLQKNLVSSKQNLQFMAECELGKKKVQKPLPVSDVITDSRMTTNPGVPDDLGLVINLTETSIRKSPHVQSSSLLRIPRLSELQVVRFEGDWALVQFMGTTGYVDVGSAILRSDFAYAVLNSEGKWLSVVYRQNGNLVLRDGSKLHLSRVKAMATRKNLGIICNDLSETALQLYLRQHVKITQVSAQTWLQSKIDQHGLIWWQKKSNPEITLKQNDITTEDLLEKSIFSMDFSKTNPNFGLVSARGVFKTEDGKFWKKINYFSDQNLPLKISKEGKIYVGTYVSHNQGKTFEPYLKWDQVAKSIEAYLGKTPLYIKISQIDIVQKNQIDLKVDTGYRVLKMSTFPHQAQIKIQSFK